MDGESIVYPRVRPILLPNSADFESLPLVKPTGFREYDARWWFGCHGSSNAPELNLMGAQAVGIGIGTLARRRGVPMEIVTGHDFRGYSSAVKMALVSGLMAAGMRVHDIGLALSPMAYFAQFKLDCACVAMVTASHNENGWTGIKMGFERPVTFGPDEMSALKEIVLSGDFDLAGGGSYYFHEDFARYYIDELTRRPKINRKLKVVVACGNGTAGAFAPAILQALGCEVIPLDTQLDHSFPRYNPNPEDMAMLHAMGEAVGTHRADIAFGFDGDGDRCGVVDNVGRELFADKVGVLLARDLAKIHGPSLFVVDVKSTGLFSSDPALKQLGAEVDYWKTGHSYIKRRVRDLKALAGFEKSGHFFFNAPIGRGYDDGLVTAIAVMDMLDRNPGKTLADLYEEMPQTWSSPTMAPYCRDEVKYDVVERIMRRFTTMKEIGEMVAGQPISELLTVNGVRVTTSDGTWGLVRASSNKPELVVVIESPVSKLRMHEMFSAIDSVIRQNPEVGAYNQSI
nr:phosphomannomutase/phosphoglucomutase [Microvirga sp. ACRRW]